MVFCCFFRVLRCLMPKKRVSGWFTFHLWHQPGLLSKSGSLSLVFTLKNTGSFRLRGPHRFQGPNTRAEYVILRCFRLIRYPGLGASIATNISVPYPCPIRGRGLRSSGCLKRVCVYGLCIPVREWYLPIAKIAISYLACCWLNATTLVPLDLLSPSNHRKKWGFVPRKGRIFLD